PVDPTPDRPYVLRFLTRPGGSDCLLACGHRRFRIVGELFQRRNSVLKRGNTHQAHTEIAAAGSGLAVLGRHQKTSGPGLMGAGHFLANPADLADLALGTDLTGAGDLSAAG